MDLVEMHLEKFPPERINKIIQQNQCKLTLEDYFKANTNHCHAEFLNNIKAEDIDIDSLSADETKILFRRLLLNLERN